MSVSDNSFPPSTGDPQLTPPPAPGASAPAAAPAQSWPAVAPAQPTQAYPGAVPSYSPPPAPPVYGAPTSGYGAPAASQGYGAVAPLQPPAPSYGAPQAYGAPLYAAPRPTSGLAITSLVCGIAGLLLSWLVIPLLASIVAVITGHMALGQTKRNPAIGGRGLAFAGLILGYVVVLILAITIVTTVIGFIFFGAFTLPFLFAV